MALVSDNTGKFLRDKQTNKPTATQESVFLRKIYFAIQGLLFFPQDLKKCLLREDFSF